MAEPHPPTGRLSYALLFVALAAGALFVRLLPLSTAPQSFPGPDLMQCLVIAWVLRRPDFVPAPLVAGVFLLADLLLMRPPGAWALIVLLGTEFLRARQGQMRELGFPIEWGVVTLVMAGMFLTHRFLLALTLVPQPALGLALLQLVATVLAYPVVVLISHTAFRVRKPTTGEVDSLGRRL